jgi:hypothetical protein
MRIPDPPRQKRRKRQKGVRASLLTLPTHDRAGPPGTCEVTCGVSSFGRSQIRSARSSGSVKLSAVGAADAGLSGGTTVGPALRRDATAATDSDSTRAETGELRLIAAVLALAIADARRGDPSAQRWLASDESGACVGGWHRGVAPRSATAVSSAVAGARWRVRDVGRCGRRGVRWRESYGNRDSPIPDFPCS